MILLFFDPDEPGTTGEKLSKLLQSIGEMDHKLLIVLNKANQLKKIHDFARAYGSLCWKLSKVIPRKDLPRIFTDVPDGGEQGRRAIRARRAATAATATRRPSRRWTQRAPLADLRQTRDDVIADVMKGADSRNRS